MVINQQRLKELLRYDSASGVFVWIVSRYRVRAGDEAGTPSGYGYLLIKIDQRLYRAHRLAWLYEYGTWPKGQIDHINGVRRDNRIANLRDVTSSENQQNRIAPQPINSTGMLGVRRHHTGKFQASIKVDGKTVRLGLFKTIEEASKAYWRAKPLYHPASIRRTPWIIP